MSRNVKPTQSNSLSNSIHIGFLARDFLNWGGGVWFVTNLLRGLATYSSARVRITVLVPIKCSPRIRVKRFAKRLMRATLQPSRALDHLFGSESPQDKLWNMGVEQLAAIAPKLIYFDGSDKDLMYKCSEEGINVILPVMSPPVRSSVPWVGYLPDCQHKHYPQFFSSKEIASRDRLFSDMLNCGSVVFANAQSVIADIQIFFPSSKAELCFLPFAPMIHEDELASVVRNSQVAQHSIANGSPYFIVCNQLWIHKDHGTAFRAFASFTKDSNRRNWHLVCTGLTEDYRVQGYFDSLKALLVDLGIAERVIFTGYIERSLQQSLIYGAVALIQPTLFEGGPGGGAATDAVALGVPCLLSDITVNREVSNKLIFFFSVGDPDSLALAMERIVLCPPIRPNTESLLEISREHALQLGEALLALAEKAIAANGI